MEFRPCVAVSQAPHTTLLHPLVHVRRPVVEVFVKVLLRLVVHRAAEGVEREMRRVRLVQQVKHRTALQPGEVVQRLQEREVGREPRV